MRRSPFWTRMARREAVNGRRPFIHSHHLHQFASKFNDLEAFLFWAQQINQQKRVHFAGEHGSITAPGLESAVESAQRASKEITARLS
jgi:hypothetical protein